MINSFVHLADARSAQAFESLHLRRRVRVQDTPCAYVHVYFLLVLLLQVDPIFSPHRFSVTPGPPIAPGSRSSQGALNPKGTERTRFQNPGIHRIWHKNQENRPASTESTEWIPDVCIYILYILYKYLFLMQSISLVLIFRVCTVHRAFRPGDLQTDKR